MIKKIILSCINTVLLVVIVFSMASCGMREAIPQSDGEITTFTIGASQGRLPNGSVMITLKNKDTNKTYSLVFNQKNNYTRAVKIESGHYFVESVDLSSSEYKAFFCTLDEMVETYVMSDEELEKFKSSEDLQAKLKEQNAKWDGERTLSIEYEDYVYKNEIDILSGESYNYYVSLVVLGTTFSSFIKSNLITIVLIVLCCLSLIIFQFLKKRK